LGEFLENGRTREIAHGLLDDRLKLRQPSARPEFSDRGYLTLVRTGDPLQPLAQLLHQMALGPEDSMASMLSRAFPNSPPTRPHTPESTF